MYQHSQPHMYKYVSVLLALQVIRMHVVAKKKMLYDGLHVTWSLDC